jgi:hypothetical protein
MQPPLPHIDPEIVKLLSVDELRRVIAILKSHRRHTIGELPPGPASVVDAIIRDARLREGGRS